MIRLRIILLALLTVLIISGCGIFPYVYEFSTPTPTVPGLTPVLSTRTPAIPTATLENGPTSTPSEQTPTPIVSLSFGLQKGNPLYLPNFTHPEAGCAWLGVAGQVFDAQGNEILGLKIVVGDYEEGGDVGFTAATGDALAYGLGGYELQISETPVDSQGRYWIQVYSPDDSPLSDRISFETFDDCERNLVLVNFIPLESHGEKHLDPLPTPTLAGYP